MKFDFHSWQRWFALCALLGTLAFVSGCETPEPDNRSARPWNSPKSWENGLPSGLTEGR